MIILKLQVLTKVFVVSGLTLFSLRKSTIYLNERGEECVKYFD